MVSRSQPMTDLVSVLRDMRTPLAVQAADEIAALKARVAELEGKIDEARQSLGLADKMLSEHIEKYHDFDYQPNQVPPELSSLRTIEHHLMGSLILDEDIAALSHAGPVARDGER